MKVSTFTMEVEHKDNEDPVSVILQNMDYRIHNGDWKDYITTITVNQKGV